MSLFRSSRRESPALPTPLDELIPVRVFDLSKRYDLYCSTPSEDRLYEDVKIVGIRSFEKKKHEFSTALIGGYLEIEARNGARMMVPHLRMYMICEHGAQPSYKVLRVRRAEADE
jgi:hypothetical protein